MKFAFYKARGTFLDRVVRWWQRGPYSHVEVILADGGNGVFEVASSVPGEGVRIAKIELHANAWDIVDVSIAVHENTVRAWFEKHAGKRYDWLGVLGFVLRPVKGERRHYFCSEAIATAIGIRQPWRYDPNGFADLLAEIRAFGKR